MRCAAVLVGVLVAAGCSSTVAGSASSSTGPTTSRAAPTSAPTTSLLPTTTSTTVLPTTTSTTVLPAGVQLEDGTAVAWTRDGHLVVVDLTTGAQRRQLASVRVGVGIGPFGSLALTADRRAVFVGWTTAEPGCWFALGVTATDGSTPIQTLDQGIGPTASPDGHRLAYLYASTTGFCDTKTIVVRELATGQERRIAFNLTSGISYAGGPWWEPDSRHLVLPIDAPGQRNPSTRSPRIIDAFTATDEAAATVFNATCGGPLDYGHWPQAVTRDGHVLLTGSSPDGKSTTVSSCDPVSGHATVLFTMPSILHVFPRATGSAMLVIDLDGKLWRWNGNGAPIKISNGPFESITW